MQELPFITMFDYFIDSGLQLFPLAPVAAPPRRSRPPRESRTRKHSLPLARTYRRNEDPPSVRVGHPPAHTLQTYRAGLAQFPARSSVPEICLYANCRAGLSLWRAIRLSEGAGFANTHCRKISFPASP